MIDGRGGGEIPIAIAATNFNLGHASNTSFVIGILVVITTSASFNLSITVPLFEGVVGYSVYVCLKSGEKLRPGEWMPSRRTMLRVAILESDEEGRKI